MDTSISKYLYLDLQIFAYTGIHIDIDLDIDVGLDKYVGIELVPIVRLAKRPRNNHSKRRCSPPAFTSRPLQP